GEGSHAACRPQASNEVQVCYPGEPGAGSMNVDALRELSSDDLAERLDEVKEEFFNLRFQNATGQLENFAQIKQVKREIARINTLVHERELGIEIEPKPQKVAK